MSQQKKQHISDGKISTFLTARWARGITLNRDKTAETLIWRMQGRERESACKPGSVVNSHSSRIVVTNDLKRPTRIQRGQRRWISIWPCSRWGLPCHDVLPRARCALTATFHPYRQTMFAGGLLSAALSVGSRPPGVTWHPALWSPDFPPAQQVRRRLLG